MTWRLKHCTLLPAERWPRQLQETPPYSIGRHNRLGVCSKGLETKADLSSEDSADLVVCIPNSRSRLSVARDACVGENVSTALQHTRSSDNDNSFLRHCGNVWWVVRAASSSVFTRVSHPSIHRP